MKILTSLKSGKSYGLYFKQRDYPKFEGTYNCYISIYGELSGKLIGYIYPPIAENCTPEQIGELSNLIENKINNPFQAFYKTDF